MLKTDTNMLSIFKRPFRLALTLMILMSCTLSQFALACATCGCSEVCPIAMMDATNNAAGGKSSVLTDSIWGNIILRMAYARDPELQKLARKAHVADVGTFSSIALIAGGTAAQNIVSMSVLNPPEGIEDSYVPGSIGLGLDGATNVAFTARLLIFHRYKKLMKARQIVLKNKVETILEHLEFSQTACPEAQTDLAGIIGERAAQDCVQLWKSSHAVADLPAKLNIASNKQTGLDQ